MRDLRRPLKKQNVAICFDLDGVLIHTMPFHAKAWHDAARSFGLSVPRRWIYEREGEPGVVTARALLTSHGRPPSQDAIRTLLNKKERLLTRLAQQTPVDPQLVQLMSRLSRQRVRLALVTGTSSREVCRLVPQRILGWFDIVVTGDCVKWGKPHPEPYQRAFHRLKIKPEDAIVVENAPYGIEAARKANAGFIVALTSSLPRRFLRGADLIVTSVRRLCVVLEEQVDNAVLPSIQ